MKDILERQSMKKRWSYRNVKKGEMKLAVEKSELSDSVDIGSDTGEYGSVGYKAGMQIV